MRERICRRCGIVFPYKNNLARYCPECRKTINRERAKKYRTKRKERPKLIGDPFCFLCAHKIKMHLAGGEVFWACGYILDTGEMRACEPGIDCIRFVPEGDEEVKNIRIRMKYEGL